MVTADKESARETSFLQTILNLAEKPQVMHLIIRVDGNLFGRKSCRHMTRNHDELF